MSNSKITKKEYFTFAFGLFGQNAMLAIMGFLMIYFTDAVGLSAAIAGIVIVVGKVWDAVTDPIMGVIVDRTNTKMGKYRPYLLFSSITLVIIGIACFMVPSGLSTTMKIVYIYITYILFWTAFTALDVSYWALIPAMTKTADERNKINAFANFGAMPGMMIASIAAVPLIMMFGGTNSTTAYFPVVAIFLVIMAIGTISCFATSKERYTVTKGQSRKLKDTFNVIFKNKPLLLVLVSLFLVMTPSMLTNSSFIYYTKYVMQNESLYATINIGRMITMLIVIVFSPMILNKIGKKLSFIISIIVSAIPGFLIYFISDPTLIIVAFSIGGLGFGLFGVSYTSMIADTVEYGQWRTGKRSEGMVYSSRTFTFKIAQAIGVGAVGVLLAMGGYNGIAAEQSASAITMIKSLVTLIPSALMLIGIIPMIWYDLSEKKYKQIVSELEQRT